MGVKTIKELHSEGFEELNAYWEKLDDLEQALHEVAEDAFEFVEEPIERALEKITSFEPSVSIIGQVKAGKSTLLNALIGETNLLPSDVNPWTSVITGIHLNSRNRPFDTRALFRFFDEEEWDRLVNTGGRLGEMANRAGFEAEADEIKSQVMEMRQTTEERLGDQFKELIGSSHAFEEIDKSVIDRYICYGDPEDLAEGDQEGVFADLTKTADLYIDVEGAPRGLCLRDTPGVNDTFMMREQITLNAISESRVCVVVLSAHQALSTMDMALLRIICSVEAREVLIFVNRIDELPDPTGEAEKIKSSIEKTLNRLGLDGGIEILFGSGYWANNALNGDLSGMAPASLTALEKFAAASGMPFATEDEKLLAAMAASGVPTLHKAIAKRIIDGPAGWMINDIKQDIDNIVSMTETVNDIAGSNNSGAVSAVDPQEIRLKISDKRRVTIDHFNEDAQEVRKFLEDRLKRAQQSFVSAALDALESHIATYGERESWNHEPTTLRMMMRTAYLTAGTKLRRKAEARMEENTDSLQEVLEVELGLYGDDKMPEAPELPDARPPTALARTLSLDLNSKWWQRFWGFGSKKRIHQKYSAVIVAETDPLIEELLTNYFDPHATRIRDTVEDFALDQGRFVHAILDALDGGKDGKSDSTRRNVA